MVYVNGPKFKRYYSNSHNDNNRKNVIIYYHEIIIIGNVLFTGFVLI